MERTKRVALAGRSILIDSSPDATLALADEGLVGDSDLVSDVIRVRNDLTDEQWSEVVLHELMHFVWHLTALPHLVEEHEETVIRSLTPWLHRLVRLRSNL